MAGNAASDMPERQAILVLGMHRSGTSALTRVLNLLGCDVPRTLVGGNTSNERGYWESDPLRVFNDQILESAGSRWDDWQAFNPDWYQTPRRAEFLAKSDKLLTSEFGTSRLFVFKDPRMCRILPFWREALAQAGITIKALFPVRNPLEVVASLQKRDGMSDAAGLLLWLRHVLEGEYQTRGLSRDFVVYQDILKMGAAPLIETQTRLGLRWPRLSERSKEEIRDFIDSSLRHHDLSDEGLGSGSLFSDWIGETYQILTGWARTGENPADQTRLDRIRQDLDSMSRPLGQMVDRLAQAQATSQASDKDVRYLRGEAGKRADRIKELEADLAGLRTTLATTMAELEALRVHSAEEARVREAAAAGQIADLSTQIAQAEARARAAQEEMIRNHAADLDAIQDTRAAELARFETQQTQSAEAVRAKDAAAAELGTKLVAAESARAATLARLEALQVQSAEAAKTKDAAAAELSAKLAAAESARAATLAKLETLQMQSAQVAKDKDAVAADLTAKLTATEARARAAQETQQRDHAAKLAAAESTHTQTLAKLEALQAQSAKDAKDKDAVAADLTAKLTATEARARATQETQQRDHAAKLAAAESARTQTLAKLEALQAQSAQVAKDKDAAAAELSAKLAAVESARAQTLAKLETLQVQSAEAAKEAKDRDEAAARQMAELTARLTEAESRWEQETGAHVEEIARLTQRGLDADTRLAALQETLSQQAAEQKARETEFDALMAAQEEQLASAEAALTAVRDELSQTRSALLQRGHEAKETAADLSRVQAELTLALADKVKQMAATVEARKEVETQKAALAALHATSGAESKARFDEISRVTSTLVQREEVLSRHVANVQHLDALTAQLRAGQEALQKEVAQKTAALSALQAQAERQSSELAQLSALVQDGHHLSDRIGAAIKVVLASAPRPWLSAKRVLARKVTLLRGSALFDADWYAAQNADVRSSSMDPALHYILFGQVEGRAPSRDVETHRMHRITNTAQNPPEGI